MRPRRTVLATLVMAGALSVIAAGTARALIVGDGGGGGGTNTCSALHLAFATQPGGGAPGSAWAQQPVVDVMTSCNTFQFYDLGGPVITLAITSGTGTSGAVLTCTSNPLTIGDFADGVTFSGCKINLAGQYTLTATVTNTLPAAAAATSNPFNIGTPPVNSPLTLAVSGSQTFGSSSPTFQVDNPPSGVTLTGDPTCTTVGSSTPIDATLPSASYTILGSSCSGVSATNYKISYVGTDLGFDVNPAPLTVKVSGTKTFGQTPAFSSDAPSGTTGTLSCSTVGSSTTIDATLGVGSHTILGSSCSGLSLANHTISYAGVTDGFVVSPAPLTVNVSGSQTFGGSPSFTSDAPSGATGTLSCSTVGSSTTINAALSVGSYTILGSSCSGLSLANHTISYAGVTDGFVVNKATLTVNVSGSQTFGGSPSFGDGSPSGVTGTPSCLTVDGGTSISASLPAGTHTIDGSSCSDVLPTDATDFVVAYQGATDGFVVTKATITVNVSGSQTYGTGPIFTETDDAPSGVTLSGPLTCAEVSPSTPITSTLTPTSYTLVGSTCSGLTPSDATDYTVVYTGVTNGFVVSKATITVNVSGSQTFGGTPSFTQTNDAPGGVTLSGPLTCSKVSPSTPITSSLAGGTYTVLGSSCTGLTPTDATDYVVSYAGVTNGFVVSKAVTSLLYNTPNFAFIGTSFQPSAVLSSAASACAGLQPVSFSLDANPLTGAPGTYSLATATTTAGGTATGGTVSTTGWLDGVYTVTVSYAGTVSCEASSDAATISVASPGDAASGGGWYNLSGSGRINFGFTVRQTSKQPSTYAGQLVLINTGKWRVKGTLTSYGKTGTSSGSASGSAALYWWNQTLNAGLGGWQLAKSPVSVLVNFSPTAGGKKAAPGTFGIQITYKPVAPQPGTLPNSSAQLLKGGNVSMS